jgi:hypothetical protein
VIVSHPMRASQKPVVEVVLCSTQRAQRKPELQEIILDQADGLDWPTLCKCDLIYGVEKTEIKPTGGKFRRPEERSWSARSSLRTAGERSFKALPRLSREDRKAACDALRAIGPVDILPRK